MSAVQYMILVYAVYLIYSGFSNKKKLKNPNPVFPDEDVNILFTKIDKTLKLCSSICIFLGGLIILSIFVDVVFDFKNINVNCVECKKIGNFLFRGGFLIFCLSIILILINERGIAGNLNGLKETITEYYEKQEYRKRKEWINNNHIYEPFFSDAESMKRNIKYLLRYYYFTRPGLYLHYISLLFFIISFILNVY